MLSYPIDEAETLLSSKLTAAKTSLNNCEEDLDFLREQITVRMDFKCLSNMFIDLGYRLWRSQQLVCTTGRWCRNVRIKQTRSRRQKQKQRKTKTEKMINVIDIPSSAVLPIKLNKLKKLS
jgi:hypothetical protein